MVIKNDILWGVRIGRRYLLFICDGVNRYPCWTPHKEDADGFSRDGAESLALKFGAEIYGIREGGK